MMSTKIYESIKSIYNTDLYGLRVLDHDESCDFDPKSMSWKREIGKNELAKVCLSCQIKINKDKKSVNTAPESK